MTKNIFSVIFSVMIWALIYNAAHADADVKFDDSRRHQLILKSTQQHSNPQYNHMVFTTKNYTVLDGTTIQTTDQKFEKVKLWGIQTPDYFQTCQSKLNNNTIFCGKNSTHALVKFTKGKPVICTTNGVDETGIVLAECKNSDDENINGLMVISGQAIARTHITKEYINEQATAQHAHMGLWNTTFEDPLKFRNHIKEVHEEAAIYMHHKNVIKALQETKKEKSNGFEDPEGIDIFTTLGDYDEASDKLTDTNFHDHLHTLIPTHQKANP